MLKSRFVAVAYLLMVLAATSARADDQALAETARKTLQSYEKGVIYVNAIAKLQVKLGGVSGQEQEQKLECLATIIDPAGLAVTSLANVNPQTALPKMHINRGGESQSLEIDCEVRGIKYHLADGTEVPGRIVFKDEDLDLAFLVPEKPLDDEAKAKVSAIAVDGAERKVELLDQIINLGRMSKTFDFTPSVELGRISAIITKPRTNYFGDLANLGAPVFDSQGKFLGLVVRYVSGEKEEVDAASGMAKLQQTNSNRTILPAADIAKLVAQAQEEAKKPAASDK